jgi:hypothetical protein
MSGHTNCRKAKMDRSNDEAVTAPTHGSLSLAVEQLDDALSLFLDEKHYVSSLTLAGAAEEILGRMVRHAGQDNFLDYKYRTIKPLEELFSRETFKLKELVDRENSHRNVAKHWNPLDEGRVIRGVEDAALQMLVRALYNYDKSGLDRTTRMHEFETWLYEHIIGIDGSREPG